MTAINLKGDGTLILSMQPDHYEFRVLKKVEQNWQETGYGPLINRESTSIFQTLELFQVETDDPARPQLIQSYFDTLSSKTGEYQNLKISIY